MRTIKFRAWTGKRMIYQDKQYLASFIRRIVPEINLDHGNDYPPHESYLPNGGVIDEYLQQFTGLHDKNGKEIYEGDKVRKGKYVWEVCYRPEWGKYILKNLTPMPQKERPIIMSIQQVTRMEIIGNIYESEQQP